MSTFTNRLNLEIPDALTDSMTTGDNVLSDNYDKIDLNIGCRVVSALTDVITPFEGQHVLSLDDGFNYIRRVGAWTRFTSPPASNGGSKGTAGNSTKTTVAANTETLHSSVTFTPEVGKRYLIRASMTVGRTASETSGNIRLRTALGASVTSAGTLIAGKDLFLVSVGSFTATNGTPADLSTVLIAEIFPNNTSQLTVGLFLSEANDFAQPIIINPTVMAVGNPSFSSLSVADWGS